MSNQERFPENQLHRLTQLLVEMKHELIEFVTTRVELFRSEIQENVKAFKAAAPLAIIAVVLLSTAYLLFTLAVVGLIAVAFLGNPYAWFFAFLIAAGAWTLVRCNCGLPRFPLTAQAGNIPPENPRGSQGRQSLAR